MVLIRDQFAASSTRIVKRLCEQFTKGCEQFTKASIKQEMFHRGKKKTVFMSYATILLTR